MGRWSVGSIPATETKEQQGYIRQCKCNLDIILSTAQVNKYYMAVNILIFTGMASDIWFRPIGAYRIATELRNQGYTVQVVDLFPLIVNHKRGLFKKIIETFVGPETLWVGFSSTFFYSLQKMKEAPGKGDGKRQLETQSGLPEDEDLPELRQTIMDRNPNCKLVMGGGKAPMRGTNIIDIYVEGYADTSVIKMTKYLEGKNPFFQFRKNEDNSISVVDDPKASHFDFVNSSTVWHPSDHIFPGEALPIEISRGCIFNCSFCAYPLNGKKKLDYMRDTGLLREEFQRNYDLYGTTEYVFMDDTHNDSVDKLEQLYDEVYSRLKFKVRFTTYLRLDLLAAKPHSIDLLHASGLRGAFFGIESLNYQSSKTIGKGLRPERAVETLHKVREVWGNDVATGVSFIVGLPHDTEETVNKWLTQATDVNFPNDSITIFPLYMPYVANDRRLWKSDIESNPEKYGYTVLGELDANKLDWKTEHFDWTGAKKLADRLNILGFRNPNLKLNGRIVFEFAGLGLDHSPYINKAVLTFDNNLWNSIYQQKRRRAVAYKNLLCHKLNIPAWSQSLPKAMPTQLTVKQK